MSSSSANALSFTFDISHTNNGNVSQRKIYFNSICGLQTVEHLMKSASDKVHANFNRLCCVGRV
jgi:hypothetical protein